MSRKNVRKDVDKIKSKDYLKVAESFAGGAEAAKVLNTGMQQEY